MSDISIKDYEGRNQHVDSKISESDFMDATKAVVYAATPKAGDTEELMDFRKVGLIQSMSWQERKELSQIFELGSEIPYQVPGRVSGGISFQRVLLSGKDLLNALYHGDRDVNPDNFLKSLGDIDAPLYLMFAISGSKNVGSSSQTVYSRVFANCHITSRNESIGAGSRIIMESASISYSHISDAKVKSV